jgi:hypothetical protein
MSIKFQDVFIFRSWMFRCDVDDGVEIFIFRFCFQRLNKRDIHPSKHRRILVLKYEQFARLLDCLLVEDFSARPPVYPGGPFDG